ncbi:MAG: hypothetical protein ACR2NP_08385, partial [Pirellulaceae bacterium]
MNSFWTWLLGDQATRDGTPQLQWAGMPESWGVFVLIAAIVLICAFVFWLYTREIDTCPRPVKIFLGCLRFTVLLLLVLMFLRPSVVFTQTNTIKANIALLRDISLSFARTDSYADSDFARRLAAATGRSPQQVASGQATRAELLQEAMANNNGQFVQQIREKGSLWVRDFARVISTAGILPAVDPDVEIDDANTDQTAYEMPPLIANKRETDIWQGLRETLGDSSRLSAIILASDGQHNGSEDPLELARKAGQMRIPIFTIGVGDPSRPRNLSVNKLYVRDKAPVGEPFEIEADLYAEDISEPSVTVQLMEHEVNSETGEIAESGALVDTVDVEVPTAGGRLRADFQRTVRRPGSYAYTVAIEEVDGESESDDNTRTSGQIQVVDEKVKVLLIAGAPTWEYRMLQRLMQRDSNIILSCWLQTMDQDRPQEGNEPIDQLPRTLEELGQYNVIMMIDPDPDEFDLEWIETLKRFCKRNAGGLFYMAGPMYTNMFVTLNRLSGIRDVLPVRFGDAEFIDTSQVLASTTNSRPGKMLVVNHNIDHPVMSFVNDIEENRRLWGLMPAIYWSFPTLAPKPTSQVLMERGDQINVEGNQPLLVAGRYGAGNVLY